MTKYLFLTTIFAINHAGKQGKEEVSPVPSQRSQGVSSSDSSREVSPDPQERIRELEKENAQLQYVVSEYKKALLKNTMSENHKILASDALNAQISNLLDRLQSEEQSNKKIEQAYKQQIAMLEKEIMPKYIALSKENKMLKAQLA